MLIHRFVRRVIARWANFQVLDF